MNLRTPLSRVRALGSAREGADHFMAQRLSAIALIPLIFWLVTSILSIIVNADYAAFITWIRSPWNTELLILLILVLFYHAHAGLQEVLADYVHNEVIKAIAMVSMKFFVIAVVVVSVLAILRMALGG